MTVGFYERKYPGATFVIDTFGVANCNLPEPVDGVASERCSTAPQSLSRNLLWAELMRRTFAIDVLSCAEAGAVSGGWR
jgi:hypothetical protein